MNKKMLEDNIEIKLSNIMNRIISAEKYINNKEAIFESGRCMTYLYLEIVKEFSITVPSNFIDDYKFKSIDSITNLINIMLLR